MHPQVFTEEDLDEIFEMITRNLFRPLPPTTLDVMGMFNPEEDEPMTEPTWPHLQVVRVCLCVCGMWMGVAEGY
jgi:serine/threonine-protein phosphatase 2A regulatory subunit B'